ncbi:MAG: hypothetical protein ACXVFU_14320 [Nocardioidaceae bacterium]
MSGRGGILKVERAHGLPRAVRQLVDRTVDGVVYRDVAYEPYRLLVELDGRLGHERSRDRWDDMDRDLLAASDLWLTVRLEWRQVEGTPCVSARRLARVLQSRGWPGRPRPCGEACAVARYPGSSSAPGADDLPR